MHVCFMLRCMLRSELEDSSRFSCVGEPSTSGVLKELVNLPIQVYTCLCEPSVATSLRPGVRSRCCDGMCVDVGDGVRGGHAVGTVVIVVAQVDGRLGASQFWPATAR